MARRHGWCLRLSAPVVLGAGLLVLAAQAFAGDTGSGWISYGHDPANTRNQPFEHEITPSNVRRLAPKWVATTTGDVSATPAVADGAVYFGDFGGTLWKLDAETGAVIWSHLVSDYTGIAGDYARTSPSLDGNTLVVGDIKRPEHARDRRDDRRAALEDADPPGPARDDDRVAGARRRHGHHGRLRERRRRGPDATFRGAIVALDAQTGKHPVARPTRCPTTAASRAATRARRCSRRPRSTSPAGLVYGTFGQPYTEPASVAACNAAAPNGFSESCEQPGAYLEVDRRVRPATRASRAGRTASIGHAPWQHACGAQPPR